MTVRPLNCWLHRFAVLTAAASLLLICAGGIVTSKGVGLAVPDWPNTYGYNMFLFPPSKWIGGVFYEHTHRLLGALVGLLTTVLAVWLWLGESRWWVRRLGVLAFFAVVLQGVLGGLRVTALKDELGIFHATLAQLFFVLVCSIALFTSRWWQNAQVPSVGRRAGMAYLGVTLLILMQLVIGATMRHQHAGLAVPDFPLAYGQILPATDPQSIDTYNSLRHEAVALNPITASGVILHMAHRLVAVTLFLCVLATGWMTLRRRGFASAQGKLSLLWVGLICMQVALGAATVWTNKSADVATAHVAVGALSLMTGAMLTLISLRSASFNVDPARAAVYSPHPSVQPISLS